MTLEEVKEILDRLHAQRCDCVLSIRCSTTCGRCMDIKFYEAVEEDIRLDART